MYVHIGGGYIIRDSDIIGFFDLDGKHSSSITNDFLRRCEADAHFDSTGEDLPRSFVLADEDGSASAIFTHISTSALKLRAGKIQ